MIESMMMRKKRGRRTFFVSKCSFFFLGISLSVTDLFLFVLGNSGDARFLAKTTGFIFSKILLRSIEVIFLRASKVACSVL